MPLPATKHIGTRPTGSGEHHYPRPITNIEFIKRDDFVLWHDDPESGTPVAVVPTKEIGTDPNPTVEALYAQPGTKLHARLREANLNGKRLELDADHPITKAAFSRSADDEVSLPRHQSLQHEDQVGVAERDAARRRPAVAGGVDRVPVEEDRRRQGLLAGLVAGAVRAEVGADDRGTRVRALEVDQVLVGLRQFAAVA